MVRVYVEPVNGCMRNKLWSIDSNTETNVARHAPIRRSDGVLDLAVGHLRRCDAATQRGHMLTSC